MVELPNYQVILTGEVKEGFDSAQVRQDFAELFQITTEKASGFVGIKCIFQKNINHKLAMVCKDKIEAIGLVVVVQQQLAASVAAEPTGEGNSPMTDIGNDAVTQKKSSGSSSQPQQDPFAKFSQALSRMALQPTPEEIEAAQQAKKDVAEEEKKSKQKITCPKCQLTQLKTEQCLGCGVYFHKIEKYQQQAETHSFGEDHFEVDWPEKKNIMKKFSGLLGKLF